MPKLKLTGERKTNIESASTILTTLQKTTTDAEEATLPAEPVATSPAPTPEDEETKRLRLAKENEEQAYTAAVTKLADLQKQRDHIEINTLLEKLMTQAADLKAKGESTDLLTQALTATYERLIDPFKHDAYKLMAENLPGKSSTGLKVLGGIMLALAVAVAALGVIFAPVLVGLAATVGLTGTPAIVATAAVVGAGSGAFTAASFTFFAKSSQTGLSKTATLLDQQAYDNAEFYEQEEAYTPSPV